MEIAFHEIEKEFRETFGYIRQDIAEILKKDLKLHYTISLLTCCACEMLTWHRDLTEGHLVFTSLLCGTDSCNVVGKTLWESLRNGLAHNFRPDTISIGDEEWRFTISSGTEPLLRVAKGRPLWIHLNIRTFASLVIDEINVYEQRLRTDPNSRRGFRERSKTYTKPIHPEAAKIAAAMKLLGETMR